MTTTTVTTEFSPGDNVYAIVTCSPTTECGRAAIFLSTATKYVIRSGEVVMVVVRLTETISEVEYHIRFTGEAGTDTITQDLDIANIDKNVFEVLDTSNDTIGTQTVDFGGSVVITGSPLPSAGLTAAQSVSVDISVDGTVYTVSRTATGTETFVDVLSDLNTVLGASATASVAAGDIVITSASSGLQSRIEVQNDDYFAHLNGFVAVEDPVDGEGGALEAYQIRIS